MRLTTLFLAFLLFHTPSVWAKEANVLLFTIDSCRANRFGVYGYEKGTTPNIDAWARTGTVFGQAYSVSAWTAPGLVSILSGLYPPTHGINNRDQMGSPDLVTLPKIFREKGYRVPNLNFFTFAPYYLNLGLGEIAKDYFGSTEESTLLNWLEKNLGTDAQSPFFLWFHTTIVHQPYRPAPEALPDTRENLEKSPGIKAVLSGAIVPYGSTKFVEEDRAILDLLYDEEIRRVDRFFGDVLKLLKKSGELQNTLIILTADHGEELLDHGFVGHASTSLRAKLYEELIRIPLIISWPKTVPAGKVVNLPVSQIVIFPTVTQLLGVQLESPVAGIDLFSPIPKRPLFFESVIAGNQTPKNREKEWVRAVRKGRFKYISTGEIYDLQSDPGEKKNAADKHPELTRELDQELDGWLAETGELRASLFSRVPQAVRHTRTDSCPRIFTPGNGSTLDYDVHTGALLFDWSGDMTTAYLIQYDIGEGDHHVEGSYKIEGNHQIMGPLPRELWHDLKAWNPFRIRISPQDTEPCWSDWVTFYF